jgi:hypothetical protein
MTAAAALSLDVVTRRGPAGRISLVILLLATLAGVWLGLAGPDVSPVAPGAAPVPVLAFLFGAAGGGVGP